MASRSDEARRHRERQALRAVPRQGTLDDEVAEAREAWLAARTAYDVAWERYDRAAKALIVAERAGSH